MKQCTHGIDGLRSTGLSPSARPFAIIPSSSSSLSLKSEIEDSIWRDYTLDLSFLSSDDQISGLVDDDSLSNLSRDVETTTKEACSGNILVNPDQVFLKLPEVLIKSSNDDKLDLSCVKTTVLSEKSFDQDDDDDSEEDSPCWRGMHSHKSLASGTKSMPSRRSTDDLSGFFRLNPLAPQFIPSNSKKKLDIDEEKKCEENGSSSSSSSSLKKSLSSTFPSSSGEFELSEPPLEDGISTTRSILTQNADEILGFVSGDDVSNTVSLLDFQTSKKLDPLAPVFVPSSAKLSPSVHEKQGAFETNPLLTSSDDKSLSKVKVETQSGEVGRSIKIQFSDGVHESGSTSSYKVGITDKSHGQRKLNPLAPKFSFANNKQKAYSYDRNQAADGSSLVVNTTGLSSPTGYWDHDADLAQSSVYMSPGSSSLISPNVDNNFGSTNWFEVEPKPTFSVKGNKALSGPSPKMDVKKLLTTIHGLSELLTLAHGSETSNSQCVEEFRLINSTIENFNLYIKNMELAENESFPRRSSSYDLKLSPNKSQLSIRDVQLPTASNMTVDLDVKRKDKYSMVSRDMVPDSRLYHQYGANKDNGFGQVVAKIGYQQNHQNEEQINQHALFYKSLWLKAEADRCLMVYETSLSNPNP